MHFSNWLSETPSLLSQLEKECQWWVRNVMPDAAKERVVNLKNMYRQIECGIVITQLMERGVNMLTGDCLRGASSFGVDNGKITHLVERITIAGN